VKKSEDLGVAVPALLLPLPSIESVELRGSRQRGDAGPFSDWDFVVRTEDFAAAARALPSALQQLEPLAAQWDRLSRQACFMIVSPGPVKIDIIFEHVPHVPEPPWTVTAATLPRIDAHFWDWTLWLVSKVDAGTWELVQSELRKMHEHLLGPLGLPRPRSLRDAVDGYLHARAHWENHLAVSVDRALEKAVVVALRALRS
jgi:hypothetical protein